MCTSSYSIVSASLELRKSSTYKPVCGIELHPMSKLNMLLESIIKLLLSHLHFPHSNYKAYTWKKCWKVSLNYSLFRGCLNYNFLNSGGSVLHWLQTWLKYYL